MGRSVGRREYRFCYHRPTTTHTRAYHTRTAPLHTCYHTYVFADAYTFITTCRLTPTSVMSTQIVHIQWLTLLQTRRA